MMSPLTDYFSSVKRSSALMIVVFTTITVCLEACSKETEPAGDVAVSESAGDIPAASQEDVALAAKVPQQPNSNALLTESAPSDDDYAVTALSAIGAAGVVKELCSAVFVTGDDPQTFLDGSSKFWMTPEDKDGLTFNIDQDARQASLMLANGIFAQAVFLGRTGCVVQGPSRTPPSIAFDPLHNDIIRMTDDWPVGDRLNQSAKRGAFDIEALDAAVDLAFADDAHTLALLVLHKGEIVAERYAPGVAKDTRLPGWSMTKTLQAAIVGRLEEMDRVNLYARVPIPEWSNDDRSQTTFADLLRMSAPLSCGNGDPQFDYNAWREEGYPYYLYTFSGPADAYAYSSSRPPLSEGEPRGYYANCQPHVLGRVIRDELATSGDTIAGWAEENLFAPLGMRSVVLENDRRGNALTAGYALATARDWARLGLLYARAGIWEGERLFSKEFMSFTRAPAPYWDAPIYGGQVWLRVEDCDLWPCDTYQMNGIEGQRVVIIPSRELVIVRLGRGAGDIPSPDPNRRRPALDALDAAGEALLGIFSTTTDPRADDAAIALKGFFAALDSGDRDRFNYTITGDFSLFEEGRVWDADRIFSVVNTGEPWRRRWTISQPDIIVDGALATARYRNTLRAESDETVRVKEWLESAVLKHDGDGWRVSFIHSTTIPQGDPDER